MKMFIVTLVVMAVAIISANASPVNEKWLDEIAQLEDVDNRIDISPNDKLNRQRRFTCDVFSFTSDTVTPNHAVCAAKCIAMRYRGGRCEGTDCICRNDKWI